MQDSPTIPKPPPAIGPAPYLNPGVPGGWVVDPPAGLQGLALALVMLSVILLSYSGAAAAESLAMGSQLLVALLGVLIVVGLIFAGRPFRLPIEFTLMAVLAVWLYAAMPLQLGSTFENAVSMELYLPFPKSLIAAVVVLNAITGRRSYKVVLIAVVLAVLLAALGGLTGMFRGGQEGTDSYDRYVGTFGNANGMGNICAYAIWAMTVLYFGSKSSFRRLVIICLGLAILAMLSSTGSRQNMLCVVVMGAGIYWFVIRRIVRSIPLKIGLLVFAGFGFATYMVYLSTTPHWVRILDMFGITHGGAAESDTARASFLKTSFQAFLDHPIAGVGLGSLRMMLSGDVSAQHLGRSPHNTIGAIGAYAGLPGWLLFFGALFMGVVRLRRVSKLPIPEADFRIVLAGWGFYLMQIVWIFTDELIFVKHFWLLFAANIGYMNWLERTYGHPAPLPVRHAPATPMRRPPATRPAGGEL